jgi:hypothetical protein
VLSFIYQFVLNPNPEILLDIISVYFPELSLSKPSLGLVLANTGTDLTGYTVTVTVTSVLGGSQTWVGKIGVGDIQANDLYTIHVTSHSEHNFDPLNTEGISATVTNPQGVSASTNPTVFPSIGDIEIIP